MSKKKDEDKLGQKLEKLAEAMRDSLLNPPDKPTELQIELTKANVDGFKAVSGYFAQTRKLKLKTPPPEDDEEFSFANAQNKLAQADRRN